MLILTIIFISKYCTKYVIVISFRFTDLNYNTISQDQLSPSYDKYRAILAYNQSKMCGMLFSNELVQRVSSHQVATYTVHPGNMMSTGLTKNWWVWKILFTLVRPFTKSKVNKKTFNGLYKLRWLYSPSSF